MLLHLLLSNEVELEFLFLKIYLYPGMAILYLHRYAKFVYPVPFRIF